MGIETSKTLLIAATDVPDPNKEEKFNKWYNEVHVPDIKAVGGKRIPKAWRYKNKKPGPGEPQYLAVYVFDTDDTDGLLGEMDEAREEWRRQGTTIEDCFNPQWHAVFELIGEF